MKSMLQEISKMRHKGWPIHSDIRAIAGFVLLNPPISVKALIQKMEYWPPQISVTSKDTGQSSIFEIKGTGFLPNHIVHIRIVDDAYNQLWREGTSDSTGHLDVSYQIPCLSGLKLHFSANDGSPNPNDATGTLWSNTFTTICP